MTAAPKHSKPDVAEILAEAAQDRAQLLAALQTEADTVNTRQTQPWRVVRQYVHLPEHQVCGHRWEWVADLCAYRRTARHASECGVFYTVRRAES